jgi:hypothetical protein
MFSAPAAIKDLAKLRFFARLQTFAEVLRFKHAEQ